MLKNISYIAAFLIAALFASCSNDRMESDGIGKPVMTITLQATNDADEDNGDNNPESRVAFTPENAFNTNNTGKLQLKWQQGDILRLFKLDAGGEPTGNGIDFVISNKSLNLPDRGAMVEFDYKGDIATDFEDGATYTAIIIAASNEDAKAKKGWPKHFVQTQPSGDALSYDIFSQAILNSSNTATISFIKNMNGDVTGGEFTYNDAGNANETQALRFVASFSLVSVQLQKPNPAYVTPSDKTPKGPFTLTMTTYDPDSDDDDFTYILNLEPEDSVWPASNATGTVLTANIAINPGTFSKIDFDVIDGYGNHYTTARTKDDAEWGIVTEVMEPNKWYQRVIGANTWTRAKGYYMNEINGGGTNGTATVWKTLRGVLTIIDGCTADDAAADGWLDNGYDSGRQPNSEPALGLWTDAVRTNLNARAKGAPLAVVYPYVTKFPDGTSGSTSKGCFLNVGANSNNDGIGSFTAPLATHIGSNMFYGNTLRLQNVEIPSATTIGSGAFQNCKTLETILMPKVETINSNAFNGCTLLSDFTAGNLKSIGANAFQKCEGLTSLDMPVLETLGTYGFEQCSGITTVSMPELTSLGMYAFRSCSSLTSVEMKSLNIISDYAFNSCTSLEELPETAFPKVTEIKQQAFSGNTSLTTVTFPKAQIVGVSAFEGDGNLATVSLPRVYYIGTKAFAMGSATPTAEMTITLGTKCCTEKYDTPPDSQVFTAGASLFNYRFPSAGNLGGSYNVNNNNPGPITLILSQGFAKWTNGGTKVNTAQKFKVTSDAQFGSLTAGADKPYGIQDGKNGTVPGFYWWTNGSSTFSSSTVYVFGKFKSIDVVPLPADYLTGQGGENENDDDDSQVMTPGEW